MAMDPITNIKSRMHQLQAQPYIPSLSDDLAIEILARVSPRSHATLAGVCRKWRLLVYSAEFHEQRKRGGTTAHFLCLLQAAPQSDPQQHPQYNVSLLNEHNKWERLPPIPDYRHWGLPLFCRFAAVNGRLVVVGGWNPATWETLRSVYIFSFSSWTWWRGADMLSTRSFFACAAVGDSVFVAGGHDNTKLALASAERFDLASNTWETLPRMHEVRDECIGAVLGGKFHAISGYHTATQCKYIKSVEVYDSSGRTWLQMDNMIDASPGVIVGASGCLYAFQERKLLVHCPKSNEWQFVDKLPKGDEGISPPLCITSYGSKLVVTGTSNADEDSYRTYWYHLPVAQSCEGPQRRGVWEALPVDAQFLGLTHASCVVEV